MVIPPMAMRYGRTSYFTMAIPHQGYEYTRSRRPPSSAVHATPTRHPYTPQARGAVQRLEQLARRHAEDLAEARAGQVWP